jgi:TatD DNase family protein
MIDSHCHLADEVFAADLDAVVTRAREAGVEGALVILAAGDAEEARQAARVCELWPDVRVAVGVHPHAAQTCAADPERAARVVADQIDATPAARAVGEIGLDYHYDFSPRDLQRHVFAAQLRFARARDLPVVVHTREAEEDTIAVLREVYGGQAVRGLLHCFTGSPALLRDGLALGLHISLAGIVTFPKAVDLRATVRDLPRDRVLVETDSPFLAPVPHRGTRNEPARLPHVVAALAAHWGLDATALGHLTAANFRALFRP